jgi:hypothetical protein
MEGVVILHETIHELHTKKLNGVVLKIDFEKGYDEVKWSFFTTNSQNKRILPAMLFMDSKILFLEAVCASKINDDIGHYFQIKRVLDKETPCHRLFLI